MNNPDKKEIVLLREALQARTGVGITSAQNKCAELLHTSRRAWQQWEKGDRKMHPAFWELINIKTQS
jgi:DNA-binding transcriptional regulator YiaG